MLMNQNIYCFKKDQPCQEGCDKLQTLLSILGDENYINPFLTDSGASEPFHLLERDGNEFSDI